MGHYPKQKKSHGLLACVVYAEEDTMLNSTVLALDL